MPCKDGKEIAQIMFLTVGWGREAGSARELQGQETGSRKETEEEKSGFLPITSREKPVQIKKNRKILGLYTGKDIEDWIWIKIPLETKFQSQQRQEGL